MTKRKASPKKVPDLVRRQRAVDATMRAFAGKGFKLGKTDCLRLFRSHAVAMGKRGLPKVPSYSSPGGAMKALAQVLERLGADPGGDLGDLMDALGFERIAPAAMLPGDIALVEAEPNAPAWRAGSLVVSVGEKFLGWHPDAVMLAVNQPIVDAPYRAAWRL